LESEQYGQEKEVMFSGHSIRLPTEEPRSHLLSIVGDNNHLESIKLKISGPVLRTDYILSFLAHARDYPLTANNHSGIAYLDGAYDEAYACSCETPHRTPCCESYDIICSLPPSVSALLVGRAEFEIMHLHTAISGSDSGFTCYWHFILVLPVSGVLYRKQTGEAEYRRIGIIHVQDKHMGGKIEQELRSQEPQTLIPV
jgi:hypothetical protein